MWRSSHTWSTEKRRAASSACEHDSASVVNTLDSALSTFSTSAGFQTCAAVMIEGANSPGWYSSALAAFAPSSTFRSADCETCSGISLYRLGIRLGSSRKGYGGVRHG